VFCFPDPRTDPWPLVYSPLPVTLVFTCCLSVVALGPSYMRQRLELRALLVTYNLPMVALSTYKFYEVRRLLVLANYSCPCQPVDYSRSELGMRMARACWWFFFSEVIELLDPGRRAQPLSGTGAGNRYFLVRKGQSARTDQVTFLHMYHHGSMLFNWRSGVKYVTEGQAFFIGMLNSLVHIFMDGYYALASLGPQMCWVEAFPDLAASFFHLFHCQFVAIAAHSSFSLFTECPFPDGFDTTVFLHILALFLYLCYRTYVRGKQ
ncbi:ELOV4 protein, partial [Falcunculus frontatus]|nr:ELOV4 protein [Falcunculus frontatus]